MLAQPMGALHYTNSCLPVDNKLTPDVIHLVIDPGYNTFDWFVSVGLRPDLQRCVSLQGGVSQLRKLVANALGSKLSIGSIGRVCEAEIFQKFGQVGRKRFGATF